MARAFLARDNEKGQALLEVTLALPLFVLLIFYFWQGSLLLRERLLVSYANYHGTRAGAIGSANQPEAPETVVYPAVGYILGGTIDPQLSLGVLSGRLDTAVVKEEKKVKVVLNYTRLLPFSWPAYQSKKRISSITSSYQLLREVMP